MALFNAQVVELADVIDAALSVSVSVEVSPKIVLPDTVKLVNNAVPDTVPDTAKFHVIFVSPPVGAIVRSPDEFTVNDA
mgnify:CR=1 FL=1